MKALTVQQPWAGAMFTGDPDFWKDVENRSWDTKYRGELAIHAGARVSVSGMESPLTRRALGDAMRDDRPHELVFSAIIGVIDLVGTHLAFPGGACDCDAVRRDALHAPTCSVHGCCESPWGEQSYVEHPTGRTRSAIYHWENANPRRLEEPVPCRGRLQLWAPGNDVLDQVREQLGVTW